MNQQRLGYCVLLLMVIFVPNKSKENASQSLYHANNNERYDNTTHFATSPRNKSAQTLKDVFRKNSSENNLWKKTRSTSTGQKELDEQEDDETSCERRLVKDFINSPRNESVRTRVDEHRTAFDKEDEFVQSTVPNNGEGQVYANETSIAFFAIPRRYEDGIYFMILPRNNTKNNKNDSIQFCCPYGHRFSFKQKKCLVDPEFGFPLLVNKYISNVPVNFHFPSSVASCENGYSLYMFDPIRYPDSEYDFYDNELIFPHIELAITLRQYCLAIVNQNGFDPFACLKIEHTPATVVATIVSSIFLLITFVVYSVLQEFRKMHNYLLRAYIASLFVSNAMYAVYLQIPVDTMNYSFCASLSFIFLFAMYSAFLWLNVMCFDIWRTTRKFSRLHKKEATPDRTSRRFMIYSLYVWRVSFVLTSLNIIMDFVPKYSIPSWLITPCICKQTVEYLSPSFWFGTRKARNIYFYLPIGITSICNICLFVWIALEILCDKKRMKSPMRDSENRRHDDCNKKRLWMCLKLFILMVINWIPINLAREVERWIVDIEWSYVWLVANLITSLKGIIIFILFVCKKKVILLLMQRFGWSESSLCHFRMRGTVHHEEVALADCRDQHNEIRESTENTGN